LRQRLLRLSRPFERLTMSVRRTGPPLVESESLNGKRTS
jgi:hypothetical protein